MRIGLEKKTCNAGMRLVRVRYFCTGYQRYEDKRLEQRRELEEMKRRTGKGFFDKATGKFVTFDPNEYYEEQENSGYGYGGSSPALYYAEPPSVSEDFDSEDVKPRKPSNYHKKMLKASMKGLLSPKRRQNKDGENEEISLENQGPAARSLNNPDTTFAYDSARNPFRVAHNETIGGTNEIIDPRYPEGQRPGSRGQNIGKPVRMTRADRMMDKFRLLKSKVSDHLFHQPGKIANQSQQDVITAQERNIERMQFDGDDYYSQTAIRLAGVPPPLYLQGKFIEDVGPSASKKEGDNSNILITAENNNIDAKGGRNRNTSKNRGQSQENKNLPHMRKANKNEHLVPLMHCKSIVLV